MARIHRAHRGENCFCISQNGLHCHGCVKKATLSVAIPIEMYRCNPIAVPRREHERAGCGRALNGCKILQKMEMEYNKAYGATPELEDLKTATEPLVGEYLYVEPPHPAIKPDMRIERLPGDLIRDDHHVQGRAPEPPPRDHPPLRDSEYANVYDEIG